MDALIVLAVLVQSPVEIQPREQMVLFVCEHGAAKSVVAAAEFNRKAAELGLPFRAISRGTAPDAEVPRRIIDGLERDGLQLPDGFAPTPLSGPDVASATRVVTFDVTLPTLRDGSGSVPWDGLPAFSDGFDAAHRAIKTKVESLIRELLATRKVKPEP
jgi:arsenate reductase